MAPLIKINNLDKSFSKEKGDVLKDINLEINNGEFIVLFGPNGCGKTTLLNTLAGIIPPDKGIVKIGGKRTNEEKIGYIFQDYRDSLLPWKTNLENIAFPLELEGMNKEDRINKAKELVNTFDINIPLSNYPYQSSGGEQQLVALLREVIAKPKIILMDEPFSALHHESRNYLKVKVQEIWEELGLTILFVSHDIAEAIQLGDKILIMDSGRIIKKLRVDIPRIRTEEIQFSEKFRLLRKEIISATKVFK